MTRAGQLIGQAAGKLGETVGVLHPDVASSGVATLLDLRAEMLRTARSAAERGDLTEARSVRGMAGRVTRLLRQIDLHAMQCEQDRDEGGAA